MKSVSVNSFDQGDNWSFLYNLLGHRIDLWDILTALSLIIPILSAINPDIDDTFALLATMIIFMANRAFRTSSEEHTDDCSDSLFSSWDFVAKDDSSHIKNLYVDHLRKKFVFEGYTSEQIEKAIVLRSMEVSKSIAETTNISLKGTALNIMQNNLSPSGSYFSSPYTGKKYAFVFGSVDDLIMEFIRDDYPHILREALPDVFNILKLTTYAAN